MSSDVEHLTCRELVEVVTGYLEHEVDPAERADIERHIVVCRGCSTYVEQMRSTIDLLRRVAHDGDDSAPSEQLLSVFREWHSGRP